MDEVLRAAEPSDLAHLAEPLLGTGLFADGTHLARLVSAEPWRVQLTRRDEIALLRRHGHLPLMLIEGLFCEEARVPPLVRALEPIARAHSCERLVSPVIDGPRARAYQRSGMHEAHRVVALEGHSPFGRAVVGSHDVYVGDPTDTEAVLGLDATVFQPFWRFDKEWMDRCFSLARLTCVSDDTRLAGYAFTAAADSRGHVMRLAVHPLSRRRGIGTALLAEALAWLEAAGTRQVTVNTQAENASARALYRRAGFRESPAPLLVLISDML